MKHIFCLCVGLLIGIHAIQAFGEETDPDLERRIIAIEERLNQSEGLEAYWDEGLRFRTADKVFKLRIGGRIQNDWAFFSEDNDIKEVIGKLEDGTEIRRARFYIRGQIHEYVEFKLQYDLTGGETTPRDVYIGIRKVPVLGTVRIGHQREPFHRLPGSSKYYTFMEKGLQNAFSPGRNTGLRLLNTALKKRVTWSAGIYRETDSVGDSSNQDSYNLTVRISGTPLYVEKGQRVVHLGGAYSRKHPDGDSLRFRERPESHLVPRFVDTGDIPSDSADLLGLEAALVLGPVSLQGEYIHVMVESVDGTDPSFGGYYVLVSYFITGETRPYSRKSGQFSRLVPKQNFRSEDGGIGAWEIAARLSGIDLNDEDIMGGELRDISIALNWYLNPNTRVMINYILADLDGVGKAHIVQSRFQIDI